MVAVIRKLLKSGWSTTVNVSLAPSTPATVTCWPATSAIGSLVVITSKVGSSASAVTLVMDVDCRSRSWDCRLTMVAAFLTVRFSSAEVLGAKFVSPLKTTVSGRLDESTRQSLQSSVAIPSLSSAVANSTPSS